MTDYIGQEKFNEIEKIVWEALEPYLEGPIHLDLNNHRDSVIFVHIVADVTHGVVRRFRYWGE